MMIIVLVDSKFTHTKQNRYPRANAQFRLSLIFASASMAGAFSGLLAYLISKMDGIGGLEGWRWMYDHLFTRFLEN
jgi:hypothetical protein